MREKKVRKVKQIAEEESVRIQCIVQQCLLNLLNVRMGDDKTPRHYARMLGWMLSLIEPRKSGGGMS